MDGKLFENKLEALARIIGNVDSTDRFNADYESLFKEISVDANIQRRFTHAERLRRLADHQLQFLMNAWLAENKGPTPIFH